MKLLHKSVFVFFLFIATGFSAIVNAGFFSKSMPNEVAVATASAISPVSSSLTLLLTPNPAGDPKALAAFLIAHPALKLTVLFPPNYFDGPERKTAAKTFQVLQSSQQIEIGLTLENQPMLPLLADLSTSGAKWNIAFEWPDDVAAQIARASATYQRRWGSLPSGIVPPYFALSEAVLDSFKRFRLSWTLAAPQEISGVHFDGSLAVIIPPVMPTWEAKDLRAWAASAVTWSLSQPIVYFDASQQTDPLAELKYLEALNKKISANPMTLMTAQEFVRTVPNEKTISANAGLFRASYSAWIASPQQKKAWSALADARQVLNAYQSSGHANLQHLDAAVEEMCNAESGPFLLELGASTPMDAERERSFSATLANVYRLSDKPVPTTLNIWFGGRVWQKTTPVSKTSEQDGPFFTSMSQNFTWNDPKGDDNGAGTYVYPVGPYPKGMFDLKTVNIQWDEETVTLSVSVAESFSKSKLPIIPLADLYIDVNRLTDAGSIDCLPRRGNLSVEREAAWEYAVSMSPLKAVLYQAVPGSDPRPIATAAVTTTGPTWSASLSRSKLRGDPKRWRLSVALMGTDNSPQAEEPAPVTFRAEATERNFGGAPNSRVTPVIDLLAATSDEQATIINVNINGGPLTLPYVEAQ